MEGRDLGSPAVPVAINTLWYLARSRELARSLHLIGPPHLLLLGPDLHVRLDGDPTRFVGTGVTLLVAPAHERRSRGIFADLGFEPVATGPVLGRLRGMLSVTHEGFTVERSVRLGMLGPPIPPFEGLRRSLWRSASLGPSGFLEPGPAPLAVFLAALSAHRRDDDIEPLARAAIATSDRDELHEIAGRQRLLRTVDNVARGIRGPLTIDGVPRGIQFLNDPDVLRRVIPVGARDLASQSLVLARSGIRPVIPRQRTIDVEGRSFAWIEGVCGPGKWSGALIEAWLAAARLHSRPVLVEVGTGTGALAILASEQRPDASVIATDISFRAVRNARENVARNRSRVVVRRGDLLEALPLQLRGRLTAVMGHLPTLWLGGTPEASAGTAWAARDTYEGSGPHGLDLPRRLLRTAQEWLAPGGAVVLSMLDWQWALLSATAAELGYDAPTIVRPSTTGVIITLIAPGAPR